MGGPDVDLVAVLILRLGVGLDPGEEVFGTHLVAEVDVRVAIRGDMPNRKVLNADWSVKGLLEKEGQKRFQVVRELRDAGSKMNRRFGNNVAGGIRWGKRLRSMNSMWRNLLGNLSTLSFRGVQVLGVRVGDGHILWVMASRRPRSASARRNPRSDRRRRSGRERRCRRRAGC